MEPTKRCSKCREFKPLGAFYRAAGMKDGYRSDCKACNLAAKHERYMADPEPAKRRVRQWQVENRERFLETQRKRRARPEVKAREREGHLLRKYGITQADYEALLAKQGGACAICRREPSERISLHVDHDHDTNRVRGLLCFRCNNALGDFDDSPSQLRRAIAYLIPTTRPPEIERRIEELKALSRGA